MFWNRGAVRKGGHKENGEEKRPFFSLGCYGRELGHRFRITADSTAAIKRGNHPGAEIFQKELEKKFKKEIDYGWMLPLPAEAEAFLLAAEYCPTSIVEQMTMDDEGTFIEKRRPIHDQSFQQAVSHTSVNSRVHM